MLRHIAPAIGLLLGTAMLGGCSYDRSFMQMDSNSGVPFFGLQWAVDSGSRPSKSESDQEADGNVPSLIDLRDPSELRQTGRSRWNLTADRNDIQTVSIGSRSRTSFIQTSDESKSNRMDRAIEESLDPMMTQDRDTVDAQSDKNSFDSVEAQHASANHIHPLNFKTRSSNAARLFHDRRAAF